MMDLRGLRYFVAVADANSFSRAAGDVGVVQSAISHQIHALEEELGVELFLREGRSVRLSAAGAVLLDDARRILDMAHRAAQRVEHFARGVTGSLRIGFQSATCRRPVVSETFHRLRDEAPDIDLVLAPMLGLAMVEGLQRGEIDGGFFYSTAVPGLTERRLYVDDWVLALPRNHPLAGAPSLRLRDLSEAKFIWLPRRVNPALYDRMLSVCAAQRFTPTIVQEAYDEAIVLNLVAVGLGIAFVLDSLLPPADGNVALKRVEDFSVPLDLCFYWNAANRNPALARFFEVLDQVAGERTAHSV